MLLRIGREKILTQHLIQNWTESYVQYSTYGTYLATFHRQGIALWGGPQWERLARFAHPGVKLIDFSPKENYLVSFSPEPITTPEGDQHNLLVWDITSGRLMRSFLVEPPGSQPRRDDRPPPQFEWPVFKWTPDDVFLARMNPDSISVYQTPDMGMLDKKSIKVEEIQGMVMSPNGNVLAYWTPEIGNNPARVTLIRLPSKEIVRTKNLFSVKECKLYFSPSGSHLAVHVTRYTKTKKSTFSNIEIFRLRERDVPIDVLEVKQTEEVQLFCWEPEGNRFAFLGIEGAGAAARNTVYFYEAPSGATVAAPVPGTKDASATPATVKLLKAMERKNVMGLHWSPKGRFIVIRNAAGELEFFDTEEMSTMSMTEHFGANHVDWDPSGRYVASTASGWKGGVSFIVPLLAMVMVLTTFYFSRTLGTTFIPLWEQISSGDLCPASGNLCGARDRRSCFRPRRGRRFARTSRSTRRNSTKSMRLRLLRLAARFARGASSSWTSGASTAAKFAKSGRKSDRHASTSLVGARSWTPSSPASKPMRRRKSRRLRRLSLRRQRRLWTGFRARTTTTTLRETAVRRLGIER